MITMVVSVKQPLMICSMTLTIQLYGTISPHIVCYYLNMPYQIWIVDYWTTMSLTGNW